MSLCRECPWQATFFSIPSLLTLCGGPFVLGCYTRRNTKKIGGGGVRDSRARGIWSGHQPGAPRALAQATMAVSPRCTAR